MSSAVVSIHAPLARSNAAESACDGTSDVVSIHAPLARSKCPRLVFVTDPPVSIHAPLARSNREPNDTKPESEGFNTCSSCEEQAGVSESASAVVFQYMLLLRGAISGTGEEQSFLQVSIHAPLARSKCSLQQPKLLQTVSIHAPLARSNASGTLRGYFLRSFNTCSSCEEQLSPQNCDKSGTVSIHAPLARSNAAGFVGVGIIKFQYMLLLRGATCQEAPAGLKTRFQYMLLLRGATRASGTSEPSSSFQYMLLLRGATRSAPKRSRPPESFNTCSSCEEQQAGFGM